jgi:uncharacterized membrane protein YfcA
MVDPLPLAAAVLTILGAAFVQGVTGFAHALLAIGFLSVIFGAREAVLILSLLAPVIAVAIFVKVRREVVWREVLALAVPLCAVGMPLGILAFGVIPERALTRIVGALLVVFAGYFLTPWAPRPRELPLWLGVIAGLVAGFIGGLASTGGPPLVLYLYAREMPKAERMAILQAVFVIGSVTKVVMLLPTGFLSGPTWAHSAILAPAVLLGVWLGQLLFRRIPGDMLRTISLVLLVGIGVVLLVTAGPAGG